MLRKLVLTGEVCSGVGLHVAPNERAFFLTVFMNYYRVPILKTLEFCASSLSGVIEYKSNIV